MTITKEKVAKFTKKLIEEHGSRPPIFTVEDAIIESFGGSPKTILNYKHLLQRWGFATFNSTNVLLRLPESTEFLKE